MFNLVGIDGNAFSIMGYTAKAMKQSGFTNDDVEKMYSDAESGDYNHLLMVCDNWIAKCNERCDD